MPTSGRSPIWSNPALPYPITQFLVADIQISSQISSGKCGSNYCRSKIFDIAFFENHSFLFNDADDFVRYFAIFCPGYDGRFADVQLLSRFSGCVFFFTHYILPVLSFFLKRSQISTCFKRNAVQKSLFDQSDAKKSWVPLRVSLMPA